MRLMWCSIACAVLVFAASPARTQPIYRRADVDTAGRLRVTTSSGVTITPRMDSDQVGVAAPAVSLDGRSVGWLALYSNPYTSYPIPLVLVVRASARERRFHGIDLPIRQWAFLDRGRRVALSQAPLHGAVTTHYELYDVDTGRRLGAYDQAPDSGDVPLGGPPLRAAPAWVRRAFARPPDSLNR